MTGRQDEGRLTPERRAALAEATVAEFARAGYEGASLNRIIRDAGMSKSSFYHFVGSKAELFDAVVRMLIADVAAQWTPPAPAEFGARGFWRHVDALLEQFTALSTPRDCIVRTKPAGIPADSSAQCSLIPALGHLGRIFYLPGDAGADGGARAELLGAVRTWVREVLQVGRDAGQVRKDLPLDLQAEVTFAVLRAIDEWVLRSADPAERAAVGASAPALVLRRLLAVQIPDAK